VWHTQLYSDSEDNLGRGIAASPLGTNAIIYTKVGKYIRWRRGAKISGPITPWCGRRPFGVGFQFLKTTINQDRLGTNVGKVEGERRFCRAPHTVPMEERVVIPDYSKLGAAQSLKESLERMGGACAEPFLVFKRSFRRRHFFF
jgi:hypothetical protein